MRSRACSVSARAVTSPDAAQRAWSMRVEKGRSGTSRGPSVRRVVGVDDLGLDAAAVAHRVTGALGPAADRGEALGIRALRAGTRSGGGPTSADAAGCCGVGRERLGGLSPGWRRQVDLVLHPVEREPRAAAARGQLFAVEVVGEDRDRLL